MAGQQFEYGLDDIGNRRVARRGGDENGWNLRESLYTPNLLNHYSNRTVPGFVDVVGVALATKPVYVNGQMASRKGEYFRRELSVNNAGGPVWLAVTVTSPGEPTVTGNLFVPRTPEVFTHDLDGNLTGDGRWTYTGDAENRLLRVQSRSDRPQGSWRRVEWQYDALGRRTRQTTWNWLVQSNLWVVTEDVRMVSDPLLFGRHIAELNATNVLVRSYVWGLDLSGTMDGAGGVGGLLWVTLHTGSGPAAGRHFAAYDGNGNIVALSAASDGSVSARYEYGPFAEPIRVTGPAAGLNPFRFSTKRTCNTTELVLYEYRPYNSTLGRWSSRDPINESGFIMLVNEGTGHDLEQEENLYRFVNNNPLLLVDKDGRNPAVIVIGGASITAAQAAAIAASVAAAICAADADCRVAVAQAVSAATTAVGAAAKTICDIRCRFKNHGPHHDFIMPRWGIPPWKRCYMKHVQVNCWIKGKSGSNLLTVRLPYGPCYKFKNAIPPVTH